MIISEFLPNPEGNDALGEFVELENNDSEQISLLGYVLSDKSGKKVWLSGSMQPGERRAFFRASSKLTLNNSDETIFLFGPDGQLIDSAEFFGAAAEGVSFVRGERGVFIPGAKPTPGEVNLLEVRPERLMASYKMSGNIVTGISSTEVLFLGIVCAAAMAWAAVFVWSEFSKHEAARNKYEIT